MIGKPIAHPRPAQHAVDALSTPPLKRIAAGVPQPRTHHVTDLPAVLGAEQVLPNDVAVAVEGRHVSLDDRLIDRSPAGGRPLVPKRQIAPEVFQCCDGLVVSVHLNRSSALNLYALATPSLREH